MRFKFNFTVIISVAILILSVMPVPEIKPLEDVPLWDKWAHMVMYGGLIMAFWLDWWMKSRWEKPSLVFIVSSLIFSCLYGGLMEILQAYCTTCRSGDWIDFFADCIGAAIGTLLMLLLWKIEKISARK